uniref:Low-density lipoprotein receptor domain class A n=1 Tax=Panagrellus redivivus TaxID=6233 RepID=A0A7E4V4Z3_PANRE
MPTTVPRFEGSSSSTPTEASSTPGTTINEENMTSNFTTEAIPTFDAITCDTEYQVSCGNLAQCVLKEYMCDGRKDCFDGSDESPDICHNHRVDGYVDSKGRFLPPTVKCPETWFFCRDASRCIEPASACDGISDCDDGSDEESFCHYLNVERVLDSERDEADVLNSDKVDSGNTTFPMDKTASKKTKSQ